MGRSEMFASEAGGQLPIEFNSSDDSGSRFVYNASEARPAARMQSTAYRPGKREDSPAATSGDTFRFNDSGTHTKYTPLTENEGYPRGYNPARQREVISALSVTADDIRKYGHRAAGHMRDTMSDVVDVPRVGGYPGEMTTTGLARDSSRLARSSKFVRPIPKDVENHQRGIARAVSGLESTTYTLGANETSEEAKARRTEYYGKEIEGHEASIAELRGVDQDVELGKAHQAVEDAAAAHVPGKEHLLIDDPRQRLGPMEMEELGKALPKTSKKRDTAARKVKFSEMTNKARTVEAIARSTVPVEDLQTIKDAQLTRAADWRTPAYDGSGAWSDPHAESWVSHVPATLGRVLNAPKTHAMVKLNVPEKAGTLGWVNGPDIGSGPVHISRASEPKTKVVPPPVTDANGRTTGSIYPVGSRILTSWRGGDVNNAERQMFYPIPKGTPKAIADRRRDKASRVTETLIHELGHASRQANTDLDKTNTPTDNNPYRAPQASGGSLMPWNENERRGISGVMEAVAENYTDAHWRPDPRFPGVSQKHTSNYDSRYNARFGKKNGANAAWRRTYSQNRIDITPPPPKSRLEELIKEIPKDDDD